MRPRLLVLDADSTLTATEGIDLLADAAGAGGQVAAITEAAMRGEIDFGDALRARVALLAGLPVAAVDEATARVALTDGAEELCSTLKSRGWTIGVVSGGFTAMVQPFAVALGLDHVRANELEIVGGALTGRLTGTIVDRAGKAAALREWAAEHAVAPADTVAVGDGANDLDMIAVAGLGIAFHAKPAVRAAADARIDEGGLDRVLTLLD